MHLGENQALLDFFASFDPNSFLTTLVFLVLGGILTFCVQSSAAVMAITMILCSSGALPIYQGIAFCNVLTETRRRSMYEYLFN